MLSAQDQRRLPPQVAIAPTERTSPWPWLVFLALGLAFLLAWHSLPAGGPAAQPPRESSGSPPLWTAPSVIAVQIIETPTPLPTPTATINPVVAAWTPTPSPTATVFCPAEVSCEWPQPPRPTATPLPRCQTPIPGDVCDPRSRWIPPATTLTPTAAPLAHP